MVKPENRVKGNNFDHWKRDEPELFVAGTYQKNVKLGRKCLHGFYLCDYHPCNIGSGGKDEVSNMEHGLVAPIPKHPLERGREKTHRVQESMLNTHLIPRHYYGSPDKEPLPR